MEVVVIPVLSDNYAYLLIDTTQRVAAAIDPVDSNKVYAEAIRRGLQIVAILTTHSHWDHSGGNTALLKLIADHENRHIPVIGGRDDAIPGATRMVDHDDIIQIGGLDVRVLHTPCHTRGHVLYMCGGILFTGDTLFAAGCGKFSAGTPHEMHHALNKVIASLPPQTKIYCGHEYTLNNLRFASTVEPQNDAIQRKLEWAEERSAANEPTIPSTIGEELLTNPFMRVTHPDVQKFANGSQDPVDVVRVLRTAKNSFGIGSGKKK